jgi:hypothetical protein
MAPKLCLFRAILIAAVAINLALADRPSITTTSRGDVLVQTNGSGSLLVDQVDVLQQIDELQQSLSVLKTQFALFSIFSVTPLREGSTADVAYYGSYGNDDNVTLRASGFLGCLNVTVRFFSIDSWDYSSQFGFDWVDVYVGGKNSTRLYRENESKFPCETNPANPGFWSTFNGVLPEPYGGAHAIDRCYRDMTFTLKAGEEIEFRSSLDEHLQNESWLLDKNMPWSYVPCSGE